jgi:peptidyl-prolyl cis-trans isomerase SurA
MMLRRLLLIMLATAATLSLPGANAVSAQAAPIPGEEPTLTDRVAAVVGDSIILVSDIQRELFRQEAQGRTLPTDPEPRRAIMRQILDDLVDLQLILQAAARDTTLMPADAIIEDRVNEAVANVEQQVGGTRALQEALARDGMTLTEFRETYRSDIRITQTRQLFLQRRLADARPVVITDEEMRAFYEEQRAQLQDRPELISLEQILIRPTAPDSAWNAAQQLADSLVVKIRDGAEFAELAREYSDDPGSAANGGDLGWFRRGNMVPEFENVAFRLPDGQVSFPVRTDYGWHLIRVERSRPGEVKARHILIRPASGDDDLARAMDLARALADSVRGGASVQTLNERYGVDDRETTLEVSRDQLNSELPAAYAQAVEQASEGEVLEPFEVSFPSETLVAVVRLAEIRAAGEFEFDDLANQIRVRLQEQKSIERILDNLRAQSYVDIRF